MSELAKIQGLKELAKALRELPGNLGKKHLNKAVAMSAKLVRDDAIRRAPVDTGRLQQAILMKSIVRDKFHSTYIVGVRHGKSQGHIKKWGTVVNLDAYYWWMVENGTSRTPKQSFLRPAFEANKHAALDVIIGGIKDGIKIEVIKSSWGKPR